MKDVAIVGSGVTGLAAGLYAARYELSTTIIGDMLGGATSTAWTVENYPGFESIDGYDLVMKMKEQVEKLGVKLVTDKVIKAEKKAETFVLTTEEDQTIETKTVVLTMGAARRKLNLPKEDDFAKGKGIHYCTTCDGPLYKGKIMAIIGGGDAAIKGANLAVQYATKIYIVEMTDHLNPEPTNMKRLQPFIDKGQVEVSLNTKVGSLLGEEKLTGLKLDDGRELKVDGVFVEIGAIPDVELAKQLGVTLDERGYITVNNMMETNIPGVYAAGDTTNFFGHFKQIITGCAQGAVAATSAFKHLG
ncbi:MAG TPA: FAD-dependent oxidoreductase [Candidatus Saccharimonadales bacterium]|nr:FAD-dependent oxidoreductase [Candidatus Saccharimonadales bacterium]